MGLADVVQGQALRSGLVVEEENPVLLLGSQCLEDWMPPRGWRDSWGPGQGRWAGRWVGRRTQGPVHVQPSRSLTEKTAELGTVGRRTSLFHGFAVFFLFCVFAHKCPFHPHWQTVLPAVISFVSLSKLSGTHVAVPFWFSVLFHWMMIYRCANTACVYYS